MTHVPFLKDLSDVLGKRMRDHDHTVYAVYAALCNKRWTHQTKPEFSCTWRSAGHHVAEIRGFGENYMDFYCHGNEGYVRDDVRAALADRGWTPEEFVA